MNVFIARDGEILGEYPQAQIKYMARNRQLLPDDHYWQEGMEDWLPLPDLVGSEPWEPKPIPVPPPPLEGLPLDRRLILGGVAALALTLLLGFLVLKSDRSEDEIMARAPVKSPLDPASEKQIQDKAADELRQKIARLPKQPTPPLNISYSNVAVEMNKTLSADAPWSATIKGREEVTERGSNKLLSRVDFLLAAEYENGEWTYKQYQASEIDMVRETTTQVISDATTATPPSIVAILGLKFPPSPSDSPTTVSKVPGF